MRTPHAANVDEYQCTASMRGMGDSRASNPDTCEFCAQAIAAMLRALAADPGNAEVLLSLGVSHVNEMDQGRAISYLMAWLTTQSGQVRPFA